jgi:polypeptide N-acetylgalactosaminyltransferase
VWSVLDKSPPSLITEILLVDDASDMPHLGQPLTDEVATIPKVCMSGWFFSCGCFFL